MIAESSAPDDRVAALQFPGRYGPIPLFEDEEEELKWLSVQEEETKRMLDTSMTASSLAFPSFGTHWVGPKPRNEIRHLLTESEVTSRWRGRKRELVRLQEQLDRMIAKEKAAKEKAAKQVIEKNTRKRQAEEGLQYASKRRKWIEEQHKAWQSRLAKARKEAVAAKARKETFAATVVEALRKAAATPETRTPAPQTSTVARQFPKSVDLGLQHAFQDFDEGDPEIQRAIFESLDHLNRDARDALAIRAASEGLDNEQYVKSQGFSSINEYVADIVNNAHLSHTRQLLPATTNEWVQLPTTAQLDRLHFELYEGKLRDAIKEGITATAKRFNRLPDEHARAKGHGSLNAWAEEVLKTYKLTPDMIPSRLPNVQLSAAEYVRQTSEVWPAWVETLVRAGDWEGTIRALPRGPLHGDSWAPVHVDGSGRRWCEL